MTCWLFVPGDNTKAQNKVKSSLSPDVIILDLEDAISEENKSKARQGINDFLANYNGNIPIVIRVNATKTQHFHNDLNDLDLEKAHGIMLPKCECQEDVISVANILNSKGYNDISIYPLIETLKGFTNLPDILKENSFVNRVIFGAVDLALDLNVREEDLFDNPLINYIRMQISLISKQNGKLPPIDSASIEIKNIESLKKEGLEARKVGYGGKLAIHPNQIQPIQEIFKISSEELKLAREIVEVFEDNNYQTIKYKDKMIDTPVYLKMKNLLELDTSLS